MGPQPVPGHIADMAYDQERGINIMANALHGLRYRCATVEIARKTGVETLAGWATLSEKDKKGNMRAVIAELSAEPNFAEDEVTSVSQLDTEENHDKLLGEVTQLRHKLRQVKEALYLGRDALANWSKLSQLSKKSKFWAIVKHLEVSDDDVDDDIGNMTSGWGTGGDYTNITDIYGRAK